MTSPSRPALIEALDVIERRGGLLRAVVAGLVLAALLVAFLAPGVLAPRPLVGAVVAVAAILIGLAVAIAVDAGDATIRGPRHVRAVGGELVGVLPSTVSADAAQDLADSVLAARGERRVVLGLTGTGQGIDTAGWTDALGVAVATRDASVLIVDVASGATPNAGLVEVVRDGASLGHTVSFEREVKLARLGAGRDLDEALRAAVDLPARLPRDLDVLLVALPPLSDGDVLAAAGALDAVLLLARSDTTTRVRLQAGIEALEKAGTVAQVVLIDDRTARPLPATTATWTASGDAAGPTASAAPPQPEPEAASEPEPAPEHEKAQDPELEVAPEPEEASESAPEPEPEEAQEPEVEPKPEPEEAQEPEVEPEETREPERQPQVEPDPEVPAESTGSTAMDPGRDRGTDPGAAPTRAETGHRPAPSVRVVRDLPPSVRPGTPTAPSPTAAGPATPQDPDVVAAAAAAGLADRLASGPLPTAPEPEAAPEPAPELAAEAAPEPAAEAAPEPAAEAAPEPAAEAAPEPGPADDVGGEPADTTDELPAVRADRSADAGSPADELRTTAQLAILMGELEERDEDS